MQEDYTLYVMVRRGVESMTPGRVAAQVNHAGTQFLWRYPPVIGRTSDGVLEAILKWGDSVLKWGDSVKNDGSYGFGRTIVLTADKDEIECWCTPGSSFSLPGYIASGIVNDPSYAVRDGSVTHYINFMTCGWIFCSSVFYKNLESFPLYTGE